MKKRAKRVPHYVRQRQYLWRIGALPREDGYHQVTVEHDDGCTHWQQERCHCDRDIQLTFNRAGNNR
jgi:hypothetical protein